MEVPRAILDEFGAELDALTGAAREMALSAVGRAAAALAGDDGLVPEENVAALRRAVSEALDAVCAWAASSAAARAAEFYAAVSEAQGAGGRFGPHAADGRDPAATYGAVRALVESVRATGDASALAAALADRADYEARRAAFECMRENAAADPRCRAFARVPSGRETCPFCLMLASFGFLPKGKRADPHVHAHCDCRIVPDFGGCSVEGYDPDGMYGRYGVCLDALGGRDGVRREWEAMPRREREAYVARHGGKEGGAFDAFLNKRVSAEIGRRDPEWFRTGKPSRPSSDRVAFDGEQVGRKFGKHCGDWGLDPAKREDRDAMMGIIEEIIDEADRVDVGEWRGQAAPCTFCLKGNDLVIISPYNEFVTVMRGGGDNKRYKGAIGADGP